MKRFLSICLAVLALSSAALLVSAQSNEDMRQSLADQCRISARSARALADRLDKVSAACATATNLPLAQMQNINTLLGAVDNTQASQHQTVFVIERAIGIAK